MNVHRGRCWICGAEGVPLEGRGVGGHAASERHRVAYAHWTSIAWGLTSSHADREPAEAVERARAWSAAHPAGTLMLVDLGGAVGLPRRLAGPAIVTLGGSVLVPLEPQLYEVRTGFVLIDQLTLPEVSA